MVYKRNSLSKTIKRWMGKFIIAVSILLVSSYIYGTKIEPNWLQVVSIDLTIPNLDSAFNSYKIVHISDLHTNKFMPIDRLNKIINSVNRQNPNAIAITGDFITKHKPFDERQLGENLSKLTSQDGKFSVLGNHDHWGKHTDRLRQALLTAKIDNLDNQVRIIERGTAKLVIAGVDDPYWGKPNFQQVVDRLPDNVPAILLVHEPDYVNKTAKTHKFALQLSGHSHGGQIRIPFLDPLVLPPGGTKYYKGLNRVEDMVEYTNRGVGMTGLPIRFGSRPEITVFTLHS